MAFCDFIANATGDPLRLVFSEEFSSNDKHLRQFQFEDARLGSRRQYHDEFSDRVRGEVK